MFGLDEFAGGIDRAVDMTFRCQVHDGIWPVLGNTRSSSARSQMSTLLKGVTRAVSYVGQRFEICPHRSVLSRLTTESSSIFDDMADDCGADKARAAGNEDFFHAGMVYNLKK